MAAAVLLGVLGQAYVIGSWFYWWQGSSFGGRTFIGCLPLFAAGLAALIDTVSARLATRRTFAAAAVAIASLLVVANLLLFLEHRFRLSRLDRPVTWHELGPGRFEVLPPRRR
jgi:hypothetical protein